MTWLLYTGRDHPAGTHPPVLPETPPWRRGTSPGFFKPSPGLIEAANAALHLRRPLLLTGDPGSGKSTFVDSLAAELGLGTVLRWHITSKTHVTDGLFDYDALGRLHATQVDRAAAPPIDRFVALGSLGTALASTSPRAVLIDEIDKSDLDLPGDLLDILENLRFTIPPLLRDSGGPYEVIGKDGGVYSVPETGEVKSGSPPVIVFTSNGERVLPAPFLRRCVRFQMPTPSAEQLTEIVKGHLSGLSPAEATEINQFAQRLGGETLGIDQLLNLLQVLRAGEFSEQEQRNLRDLLTRDLNA